jgi:prepilin-type N-terminal cleavage/methylation domain-containing protein/prepilin-type processing-associated H-X9-DG protein
MHGNALCHRVVAVRSPETKLSGGRSEGSRSSVSLREKECLFSKKTAAYAGFTLVELLATIVVLGVLAMLLLPALSSMRGAAASPGCMNNLRQLHTFATLFANDHNGLLPPPYLTSTGNPWNKVMGEYFGINKRVYEGTDKGIFRCPGSTRQMKVLYGYNRSIGSGVTGRTMRLSSVPIDAVFLTEMLGGKADWKPGFLTGTQWEKLPGVHGGKANILLMGGNVVQVDVDDEKAVEKLKWEWPGWWDLGVQATGPF